MIKIRKINPDILFLCGVLVICCCLLLFHINPYHVVDDEPMLKIQSIFWSLLWRPVPSLGMVVGVIMIFKSLKK